MSSAFRPRGRYDEFWNRSRLLVATNIVAEGNRNHRPTELQNQLIDHYESLVAPTEASTSGIHFIDNGNAITADPLIQWLAYLQYMDKEMPDDTATKLLLTERCTQALADIPSYADDKRFVNICIQYAVNATNPLIAIFPKLDRCQVGKNVAAFWIARAGLAEDAGEYVLAKTILDQGKSSEAQPADELASHYTWFLERMFDRYVSGAVSAAERDDERDIPPVIANQQPDANIGNGDSKPAARRGGNRNAQVVMHPHVPQELLAAPFSPVARRVPTHTHHELNSISGDTEICPNTKRAPSMTVHESDGEKRPAKRARTSPTSAANVGTERSLAVPDVPAPQVKQEQQDFPIIIDITDSEDEEETGTCERRQPTILNGHTAAQPFAVASLHNDEERPPDIQPTATDFLFGRQYVNHEGNVTFREVVRSFFAEYRSVVPKAHKKGKHEMGRPIFIKVLKRLVSRGTRFLKHGDGAWFEVDEETVIQRIKFALTQMD